MVIQVDILIYVYMALCACMLVFNAVYVGRRRWWSRRPRQNGKWKRISPEKYGKRGLPDKKQERYLKGNLSGPASLMVFNEGSFGAAQRKLAGKLIVDSEQPGNIYKNRQVLYERPSGGAILLCLYDLAV